MNEYLRDNLPETYAALTAQWAAVLEAAGEVSKAEAAKKRAEQAWSDAMAKADAEARAHFAANNKPSGVVVPADMLARVAKAIDTPDLHWHPDVRPFCEKAAGSVATVVSFFEAGNMRMRVRLYQVDVGHHAEPRWCRVASVDIQAHNGALPSGRRRMARVVIEEDVAALVALGVQS